MSKENNALAPLDIDFSMTEQERRSELWGKQYRIIEKRIWELRVKLEKMTLDADKTLAIRVEIKILKGLLKNDPNKEFGVPPDAVTLDELDAD